MRNKTNDMRIYLQPAFLICTAVLAISASTMSLAIKRFDVYLQKEPLPLKKSFDLLDPNLLEPYKLVLKQSIENKEIIEALGTKDYFQWIIEDTEVPAGSTVRNCGLFVTYYELPDRVPHVPEECYKGGGHQKVSSDSITLNCKSGMDEKAFSVPARHVVFASANAGGFGQSKKFSILYLFNVNGVYANSREEARLILNKNIFRKHSYFSKVEWWFVSKSGSKIHMEKEKAISASEKLLSVLLPILEREHWPQWELDDK